MSDLNVQFVREFFELHLFQVLTYWQHEMPAPGLPVLPSDSAQQLFVENTRHDPARPAEFLLDARQLAAIGRAVVEVRAWHGDRFYTSVIEGNPVLGHVASDESRALAERMLGTREFATILVISELPASVDARERSLRLLRELNVDHVMEFPAILEGLLAKVDAYAHYAPSATLQTLRLIKRYNLVRLQQLEFAFAMGPPSVLSPVVAAEPLPDTENPDD